MIKNRLFRIRRVQKNDIPQLLLLVKQLASYEHLSEQVEANEQLYSKFGFGEKSFFKALVVENKKGESPPFVGFALYFFTFSTFLGHPTLYIEDVYVCPEFRRQGIGSKLLVELAKIALNNDCGRIEWAVLNWNKPALEFYQKMGAQPLNEWTLHRISRSEITKLAQT